VQKHRIETLNKNRDALEKEWSFFVFARWCTNFAPRSDKKLINIIIIIFFLNFFYTPGSKDLGG